MSEVLGLGLIGDTSIPVPTLLATNTKILSGTGTVVVQVFRLDGIAKILKLWAVVTSTLGNHTNAHFRLNDLMITVPISKTTTATFSGHSPGSPIYRSGLAADALSTMDASTCGVIDPSAKSEVISTEVVVVKKYLATTYMEYVFDTTDLNTSGSIAFYAEYQTRFGSQVLMPV